MNGDAQEVILFATPLELGFSERARNACHLLDASCLGDVARLTEAQLLRLPNTGRKTVREIQEKLRSFDLRLGMELPDWDGARAESVRTDQKDRIRFQIRQLELSIDENRPNSLQEEIRYALSRVCSERNQSIILSLWGLDGTPRKILEEVGQRLGITRERVRQIEAKAIRDLSVRWNDLPFLDSALEALKRLGPCPADDVSVILHRSGIPSAFVNASSLLRAAEVFGRQSEIAISTMSSKDIVGDRESLRSLRRAVLELRRATQAAGCTSLTRIQFEIFGNIQEHPKLRQGLECLDEVVWLDSSHTWLYSMRPVRNRLFNILEKIFTVAPRVHVTELRQLVSRPHRMKFAPPAIVLSAFCEATDLATSQGAILEAEGCPSADLGELDGAFVRAFKTLGSPLTREELEDYCVGEEGMKVSSFFQRISYCELFSRLASGVYGLAGAPVPPGTIEEAKRRIRDERVLPRHGWAPDGRLWVVFPLSRASLLHGSFWAPAFVNDHAEGSWRTTLGDGTAIGSLEVKQGMVRGLRDEFQILAADADDYCLLKFDFSTKFVSVEIGGSDLEDQADQAAPSEDDDVLFLEEQFHEEES